MENGEAKEISAKKGIISINEYIDNNRETSYLYSFLTK